MSLRQHPVLALGWFVGAVLLLGLLVAPGAPCRADGISVKAVLDSLKDRNDPCLVDVRSAKEFEEFRIPGSLNVPLFSVKTKGFLAARRLVLFNQGHTYGSLRHEATRLVARGFDVSILDGGLNEWKRQGGPIEGDVFAQKKLNRIAPATVYQGRLSENWIIVDLTLRRKAGGREPPERGIGIPLVAVPFDGNEKESLGKLLKTIGEHKDKEFLSTILCNEDGEGYGDLERLIQGADIANVLYLDGGLRALRALEEPRRTAQGAVRVAGGSRKGGPSKNCRVRCD